jgi:hypothetical protein
MTRKNTVETLNKIVPAIVFYNYNCIYINNKWLNLLFYNETQLKRFGKLRYTWECWLEPVKKRNFVVGAEITLLERSNLQSCKKLFSWLTEGVDKLARSINFERSGVHHTKRDILLTHLKISASNFWPRWSLKWRELKSFFFFFYDRNACLLINFFSKPFWCFCIDSIIACH